MVNMVTVQIFTTYLPDLFIAMKVGTISKNRAQNRAQKNISRQFLSRRKDEKAKEAYKPISQPKNESKKVHLLLSSK